MKTDLKKYLIILLISSWTYIQGQNNSADFEFGHDIRNEFYFDFIDENSACVDITAAKYFLKRKNLKLKSILVTHFGFSLDSLYVRDKKAFEQYLSSGSYIHAGYSYVETLCYNSKGFLISLSTFPLSSNLTKADSSIINRNRTNYNISADTIEVEKYINDLVVEKWIYLDRILYKKKTERNIKTTFDNENKKYISSTSGTHTIVTNYYYGNDGLISRIKHEASGYDFYELNFRHIDRFNLVVKCKKYPSPDPDDLITEYENKIVKNKLGQITTSTFNRVNAPKDFSKYSFKYDDKSNLTEIIRLTKADGWFEYTDTLYQYSHLYENGRLIKTKVHFNFNVINNDIIFLYNENGLIKEKYIDKRKTTFQYSYY